MIRKIKDPNAVLDWTVDFGSWLETSGDQIQSVVWLTPSGITEIDSSFTATTATVWLAGGTLKAVYPITCRINTTGGRAEDYTFELQILEK